MNEERLIQTINKAVLEAEQKVQSKYRTARLAGLNPGALSRLMARKANPTIATIQAVAQALGKRVEFELADDDDAIDDARVNR